MLKIIRNRTRLMNRHKLAVAVAIPVTLALITLIAPMTVSCQRTHTDSERGIGELRALVASSAGKPASSELARIESSFPRTRAASLARFLRGYLHYSAQNYAAAIDALDLRSIGANTSLGDYAIFYRAESEMAMNAKSEALRDFGIVYTQHPESLKAREARLRAAEMALALGDPDSAIKELESMVEARDSDAHYLTAQAYEMKGKSDRAIKRYRSIYFELPAARASDQAAARLAALGASVELNPPSLEEARARFDARFEARQYWEAARAYDEMLGRFPEVERVDEIQLRHGMSLLYAKQPAQAVLPLTRVSGRNSELHAQALFHQADALRRSNRAGESSVILDRLLNQYPKTRQAEQGLYDFASYLDKQGRAAEAASRFRQLVALYPKSEYAAEASYEIGWQAYQAKNFAEAAHTLERHLATYRYPETKFIGEAGFWAAKSQERLGNKSRALALYDLVSERYKYGYHGYVAGLRAGALRASDSRLKPEEAKPGSELERIERNMLHVEGVQETATESESRRVAKADDLEVVGLSDLAIKELNEALESAPSSPRLNLRLAELYSRRGDNFQATLILRRGYPDIYSYRDSDLPREAWEIFFPMVRWDTIKEEARRYGIDPYMAAGLIRQESVFNPNAISRVGARGLMQVMPATGQLVAKRQGVGQITASDLYNPALNIKLGMSYLAQMLGEFRRIEYAAAAYNAGPGRARRWIAERGAMDIEDWIEAIPFSETRGYVQGVLRYTANYRRFYKD